MKRKITVQVEGDGYYPDGTLQTIEDRSSDYEHGLARTLTDFFRTVRVLCANQHVVVVTTEQLEKLE